MSDMIRVNFSFFVFLLVLAFEIAVATFCAVVARSKGQDGTNWFFAGLVFSLIALLAVVGMGQKVTKSPS